MPTYLYQAKDSAGQTISGEIAADDERTAAGRVRELGYYPMHVRRARKAASQSAAGGSGVAGVSERTWAPVEESERSAIYDPTSRRPPRPGQIFSNGEPAVAYGSWFERTFVYPIWTGVHPRDLALFYRQFAALQNAGLTVGKSLDTLQNQLTATLRRACWHMGRHINAGGKLSEAMSIFPHIFTYLHRSIIAASEETGVLDAVLIRISEYIEAEFALKQMVRRETFMPKINFIATFLLPPLYIAIVQGANAYCHAAVVPLLIVLCAGLGLWILAKYAFTIRPIAVAYDTIKSFLPYFGTTVRMLALAKFSRAFASLYSGGVLIPRAVQTSARVTGNQYLDSKMQQAVGHMTAGQGLTESFASTGVFPPMFLSMLSTGELTGNLDGMLHKLAEHYESESAIRLHQSITVLNVLIFLAIAAYVGYIVVGFWMGYANTINNIGGS